MHNKFLFILIQTHFGPNAHTSPGTLIHTAGNCPPIENQGCQLHLWLYCNCGWTSCGWGVGGRQLYNLSLSTYCRISCVLLEPHLTCANQPYHLLQRRLSDSCHYWDSCNQNWRGIKWSMLEVKGNNSCLDMWTGSTCLQSCYKLVLHSMVHLRRYYMIIWLSSRQLLSWSKNSPLLWNLEIYCHVQNREKEREREKKLSLLYVELIQSMPPSYFFQLHFSISLPSTPRSSKYSTSGFPTKTL